MRSLLCVVIHFLFPYVYRVVIFIKTNNLNCNKNYMQVFIYQLLTMRPVLARYRSSPRPMGARSSLRGIDKGGRCKN